MDDLSLIIRPPWCKTCKLQCINIRTVLPYLLVKIILYNNTVIDSQSSNYQQSFLSKCYLKLHWENDMVSTMVDAVPIVKKIVRVQRNSCPNLWDMAQLPGLCTFLLISSIFHSSFHSFLSFAKFWFDLLESFFSLDFLAFCFFTSICRHFKFSIGAISHCLKSILSDLELLLQKTTSLSYRKISMSE